MPIDENRARQALLRRRDELVALSDTAADARGIVELDQSSVGRLSRMDALQDQAMAQETERRRRGELVRIDAALARLDEGEYGYCITCGEEIAPKRLDIDPSAALCVRCASLD
ncbi:MAG: TraR/DksA C4-type zinc finger protein [Hyphomicrobiales bacterium]|nr:TraR/DksA C4-type zinc finger protein [Hyphomicrobiales bacterium]